MRVRIKNDLSKWNATRDLRKRPAHMSRKSWSQRKQTRAWIISQGYANENTDGLIEVRH